MFEAVENIQPSRRGELEITDTIQYLIDHQYRMTATRLEGYWTETGKMDDMLEANRWMLDTMPSRMKGAVDADSTIHGKVIIEAGAQIINSMLRGPVIIGARTRIVNSYVGPFPPFTMTA